MAEPTVETVTLTPEALTQFFREAEMGVGSIANAVARTAAMFRASQLKPAHEALATLPAELREFIVLVTVVDGQIAATPGTWVVDALVPSEQITRLGHWIESLVDAQSNEDPLTIADILEYDIEPFLRSWQALLAAHAN